MKKISLMIILASIFFMVLSTSLISFGYDYTIEGYDIDIKVNEDNSYRIKEKIKANFNVPKHGIYRTIPLQNKVIRADGSRDYNVAKIMLIGTNTIAQTSEEGGYYKVKFGSANETITGLKEYILDYDYDIGKDSTKKFDELYYNIIGSEWDTTIDNITFTITMPKEFDESKLGFSAGYVGTTSSSGITYNVQGNIITGSYNGTINPGEALTVRLELPEGYFSQATSRVGKTACLMFIIPIVGLLVSLCIWKKHGKDDEIIETVEFYPPEGFNSLEVGFLYKGEATTEDVVSLLVYLANKGYLRIIETEEKNLFSSSKGFRIEKLKEYDGDNASEKMFFDGLFKKKRTYSHIYIKEIGGYLEEAEVSKEKEDDDTLDSVTARDLYNNFYKTMHKILRKINDKNNKKMIYEQTLSKHYLIQIILIILSVFSIIIFPTLVFGNIEDIVATFFLILLYTPFYIIGFGKTWSGVAKAFWIGFTMLHSAIMFSSLPIFTALKIEKIFLFGFIVGIGCIAGIIACIKAMPKRTNYGIEVLGQIKGFKNFLELAEKEKLEEMVMEDPSYFYNILPYTYVLGVSDMWIEKFEVIGLEAPNWYNSNSSFSVSSFSSSMNNIMTSTRTAMSSGGSSSSSGGGGSSGGGSSGGGSGGGGGGSW